MRSRSPTPPLSHEIRIAETQVVALEDRISTLEEMLSHERSQLHRLRQIRSSLFGSDKEEVGDEEETYCDSIADDISVSVAPAVATTAPPDNI